MQDIATARPYTHVCARDRAIWFADRLSVPTSERPRADVDVCDLLSGPESHEFEAKGSASLNLNRWLSTDEATPVKEDNILNDGAIKAIVGMLNAGGGHVVLGALETQAQFGGVRAADHPKLQEFPVIGDFICVGVNAEYGSGGWDKFRLWLQETIGSRVDPPPAGVLSVVKQEVEGRDLCVIRTRPSHATWYYRLLRA